MKNVSDMDTLPTLAVKKLPRVKFKGNIFYDGNLKYADTLL